MNILRIIIMALIGALIGWVTNIIAIKLIFRPLYPINIPVLNIKLQGLIPKRKSELAESIGDIVENELLSFDDIVSSILKDEDIKKIKKILKKKISLILNEKLPQIIPISIKKMITSYVEDLIETKGDDMIKDLSHELTEKASQKVSISQIVEDKINSYEIEKIESIIIHIAKKELKHIEILGGVLGLVIGTIQGFIILFI